MSALEFTFLGAPDVRYQGQSIKFRSRKEFALLIYLAVETGWHLRDALIATLWPDSDRTQGRIVLRSTLSMLRKRLAGAGEVILVDGDRLAFNSALPVDFDLHQIEAMLQPDAAVALQQTTLAKIRGEFLAGFSLADAPDFDDWATMQREQWQQRVERGWDQLSQALLDSGRRVEALEAAGQWLSQAPLNEGAYRRVMETQWLNQDRSAALQTFAQCRALLAAELGVEPDAATLALADRIRQGTELIAPFAGEEPVAPQAGLGALLPFVGRQAEHRRLVELFTAAKRGQTQAMVISGEAGYGKTRLATIFLDWVRLNTPQTDILVSRAYESGGQLPFQPIVQALRARLEQENAPDDLLADVWLAELSQLLPELRDRYPDLPLPMTGEADFVRSRIFEAVATLGHALTEERPLLFFVDDLQWTDEGSRELIQYLCQRWAQRSLPIAWLFTLRQEALLTDETIRPWLTRLQRIINLTQLPLQPLTDDENQQLISALAASSDAVHAMSTWLYQETGGIPFYLAELFHMFERQGSLHQVEVDGKARYDVSGVLAQIAQGQGVPLPPSVREVIVARLVPLAQSAYALLAAAAVLGQATSFEHLCRVAHLEEMVGLTALEELLKERLLLENGPRATPYLFAHDKIREVVYTEIGEARRRLYHRQALRLLETEHAPAAVLSHHAQAAHLRADAFRYALAAGHEALALYATADAVAHFATAAALSSEVETTSAQRCSLCTSYGRALELSNDFAAAIAHYQTMRQTAQVLTDPALELAALIGESTIRATPNAFNDFPLAESLGQVALALAEQLADPVSEAKIQWNLMNIYRRTERVELALAAGERSLALAEAHELREQLAFTINDLAHVYMYISDLPTYFTHCRRAMALWRELNNRPMYIDSVNNYTMLQSYMGNDEEALALASEALAMGRALGNQWSQAFSLYTVTFVHLQRMEVGPALDAALRSIQLAQSVGFSGAVIYMSVFAAHLYLAVGALEQAEAASQQALTLAREQIQFLLPMAAGTAALVKMAGGDLDAAEQLLDGLPFEFDHLERTHAGLAEMAKISYAIQRKDFATALSLSRRMITSAETLGLTIFTPDGYWLQAQALIGLNRPTKARPVLARGLALLRTHRQRWHFLPIATLLAELEEAAGQAEIAAELRDEARTVRAAIIEQIPDGELRASFLALPQVKSLSAR